MALAENTGNVISTWHFRPFRKLSVPIKLTAYIEQMHFCPTPTKAIKFRYVHFASGYRKSLLVVYVNVFAKPLKVVQVKKMIPLNFSNDFRICSVRPTKVERSGTNLNSSTHKKLPRMQMKKKNESTSFVPTKKKVFWVILFLLRRRTNDIGRKAGTPWEEIFPFAINLFAEKSLKFRAVVRANFAFVFHWNSRHCAKWE